MVNRSFVISYDRLPVSFKRYRYMVDGYWHDYLGQILLQMGYDIPEGCKFPSELKTVIYPFTFSCRGTILNTSLTLDILALDFLDRTTHKDRLRQLVAPYGITLLWI